MSVIDIHTHAFPDSLAERAISQLAKASTFEPVGDGTVAGLIASMDQANIDLSVICSIATRPDQTKSILEWSEKIRNDRIEPFPSIHPDTPKPRNWMKKIAKAGFAGIKLHPMYQDFIFDEDRARPIFEAACEFGLIVAAHCGLDICFPPTDLRASPQRVRNVIDRHPGLKLICGHMGGWRLWDDVEQYLLGTDVYLETSFSLFELEPTRAAEMIRRHGAERVMLGSDWPWRRQDQSIKEVEQLGMDEKDLRKILWSNAARLLGY